MIIFSLNVAATCYFCVVEATGYFLYYSSYRLFLCSDIYLQESLNSYEFSDFSYEELTVP